MSTIILSYVANAKTGADRSRWNTRYLAGRGPRQVNPRLVRHLTQLKPGRVLDVAGGVGANAGLFAPGQVVLTDISEEALRVARDRPGILLVQADARSLPFEAKAFDTIVCTYYYEPAVDFASLLTPGGTLFFETYTTADLRYRPAFNPAFLFDAARAAEILRGLELLSCEETDDGTRVFVTVLARRPAEP